MQRDIKQTGSTLTVLEKVASSKEKAMRKKNLGIHPSSKCIVSPKPAKAPRNPRSKWDFLQKKKEIVEKIVNAKLTPFRVYVSLPYQVQSNVKTW